MRRSRAVMEIAVSLVVIAAWGANLVGLFGPVAESADKSLWTFFGTVMGYWLRPDE